MQRSAEQGCNLVEAVENGPVQDDIWKIVFDRDLGAQVPALGFHRLGIAAVAAWCSSGERERA